MIRVLLVVAFALLALACERERGAELTPRDAGAARKPDEPAAENVLVDLDGANLLTIASGAAVISRTAERDLETSALHAIDSIATSRWVSPEGDANQSMLFSFGAPVRVSKLGVLTVAPPEELPDSIRFSASADGQAWREVHVAKPKFVAKPQVDDVTPFEANFLRVETVATRAKQTQISSILAYGEEIDPPSLKRFGGCWTIDGRQAKLEQHGARIAGVVGDYYGGPTLTVVDGGTDGRVARLMWMRGPQWGYVVLTISADGGSLSGLMFHQNPLTGYVARAWFGKRCNENLTATGAPPEHFLRRTGFWTLSGVAFDEREQVIESVSRHTIDEIVRVIAAAPQQRFRIVSHEFRFAKEENRQRTASRVAALRAILESRGVDTRRVEYVGAGDVWDIAEPAFPIQRLLWSRVDLELVR